MAQEDIKYGSYYTIAKSANVILRARKLLRKYPLYIDIHLNGKRKIEKLDLSLTTINRRKYTPADVNAIKLAKNIISKIQFDIQEGNYNTNPLSGVEDFLEFYELFVLRKIKDNAPTKYKWMGSLKYLKSYSDGAPILFKELTVSKLDDLKQFLLINLSINTASGYFSQYNQVLKYAYQNDVILSNPMDKLSRKIPKKKARKDYLLIDEIRKLDKATCTNLETKRAFFFSCFTGLRLSDIEGLSWADVQTEGKRKVIYLKQRKTKEHLKIYLSNEALKHLGEPGKKTERVFNLAGRKYIRKHLNDWADSAGLEKHLTYHVSRHTFATLALTNDVDIKTVSELLGHANVRTTEIYAKIIDKKKEEAVDKLPNI